jgi:hypothetical protein
MDYTRDWDAISPTDPEQQLKDADCLNNDQVIGIFPSRFAPSTNDAFRTNWIPPVEGEKSIINTPNIIVTENDKISLEINMKSRAEDFHVQSSILFFGLNDRMHNVQHGIAEHPDSNNSLVFRCNYGFNDEELMPYDQNNLKTHHIKGMNGTKTTLTIQPTFHGPVDRYYRMALFFRPVAPANRDFTETRTRPFQILAAVANGV